MEKVIVTGATGFIGGALTERLLRDGVFVYGVDVSEKVLSRFSVYDNFKGVVADFSNYEKLHDLIPGSVDVFYHFAWSGVFGQPFKDYSRQLDNAKYACLALLEAVKIGARKFVFAGTMNEYEAHETVFSPNQITPRYTNIYSTSKLAAEMICKTLAYQNGIKYNAGLIAMAFGEGNYSAMMPNVVMKSLVNGIAPKLVTGLSKYDMIYIDDIVSAFIAIGESGKNSRSYYVGHRKTRIFREWINDMRDVLAPDLEIKYGEYPDDCAVDYSSFNLDMLYDDTGFECQSDFKESVRKTALWLREHDQT